METPNFLSTLTYAVIEKASREAKPNAAVRQNGQMVFSAAANKLIGFPEREYFRLGSDASGKLYLIPADKETPNVLKGTKNNESFQFRQDSVLAGVGALPKNRYSVASAEQDGITYFVLTPLTKAEAEAAEKEEAEAPAQTEAAPEKAPAKKGKK